MWGSFYRNDYIVNFIDCKFDYHYKKELYPTAINPGGRTDETHKFILQLNDKKFKNIKFVKKENKRVMTQEEIENLKNRKLMKKTIKKTNKEIISYFDFAK